jgi:hypothetical protein
MWTNPVLTPNYSASARQPQWRTVAQSVPTGPALIWVVPPAPGSLKC